MDLSLLARFAKEFREEDAQRRFYTKSESYIDEEGYAVPGRDELGQLAESFIRALENRGWLLPAPFSPVDWINSFEAKRLREDRAFLALANPEQLAKLLTTLLRQEHWVNGAMANAFDSGLLLAIVERAEVLYGASSSASSLA